MRYPKYKPTGIAWLPEVPEGWECVPFKRVARVVANLVPPEEYLDKPQISPEQIEKGSGRLLPWKTVEDSHVESDNHLFHKGQILYSKIRPLLNKVTIAPFDGLCSADMYPIETVEHTEYVKYYMLSQSFLNGVANVVGDRVKMPKINKQELSTIPTVLPPLPTQRAIVAYLDEKCGKVDRLVAAKEKEAALLKELKQSMIAEAVCGKVKVKGEGQQWKMKPSGIPWLPEVPEGWEVKRVATLLKIKDCPSAPNEELLSVFLDRGVIRFSDGGEKRANATSKDLSKYQLVEVDDFVMNNQQAWRGSVGMSRYRGIVSPAYFVVRMADCIDSKYAEYAFRSRPFVSVYELCSRGVGSIQRNLIWNMFKQQHLPVPPLAEQREIVAHIEARAAKIDAAVAGLEREVAALKEYKQRLIADVVTGQRKVA